MDRKAMDLYYDCLAIGGMLEVVEEYRKTNSLITAIDVQSMIIESYKYDILKNNSTSNMNKIIATFNSIPNQLAKENQKFQYKVI